MSVVNEVTAAPKAAYSFAKAKPLAFALLALLLVLLTIRYANKVARFLAGLPVVGSLFARAMTPAAPRTAAS